MPTFASLGKEILRDGQHFADAVSADAAVQIVEALAFANDDAGSTMAEHIAEGLGDD